MGSRAEAWSLDEMIWGRMGTRQQRPGDLRAKERGSKEGKQRGSQVSNASEKGSVRDGNMTSGKKRAEAETNERGDKEKLMVSQPRAYLLLHRGLNQNLILI